MDCYTLNSEKECVAQKITKPTNERRIVMGLFSNIFRKKKELVAEQTHNSDSFKVIKKDELISNPKVDNANSVVKEKYDIPQLQGDYAKTIFLWSNQKASAIKDKKDYAKYFLHECGIQDASEYHKNLISEGYFKETPIETKLLSLKVTDLKTLLKDVGESTTGKKAELVKNILQYVPLDVIEKACPEKMYELSDKGLDFLKVHHDYVLLHKYSRWDVNWQEYNKKHQNGESFYDTMWRIFNQRIMKDTHLFGRTEYYNMYQLLAEEGKRKNALEMLLRVLYIDLSGVEALDNFRLYKQGYYTKQDLKEYYGVAFMLAPGIIYPIAEFVDVYDEAVVDKIYEQKLPVQLCDKVLFKKIINAIMDDTYNEEKTEKELKKSYYKLIDNI